jgi:hypothetical protein
MRGLAALACLLGLAAACAPPAAAIVLGGCGNPEGASDLAAHPETRLLVTAGPQGVAVYEDGAISSPDWSRISGGRRALLFGADDGSRLAVWDAGSLRTFDFRTLERLAKVRVRGLGGLTLADSRWPAGGDEVVIVGHRVHSGFFGLGRSSKPLIARLDVTTGRAALVPLVLEGDYLSAALDATGRRVALGFAGGRVEVRSALDGGLEAAYTEHPGTPWNSMGLAFHPKRAVVASSAGSFTVFYDLESGSVLRKLSGVAGGRFLRFLGGDHFLLAGDTTRMAFHDERGRRLYTSQAPDRPEVGLEGSFDWLAVSEGARRVYTLGGNLLCWRTFPEWTASD